MFAYALTIFLGAFLLFQVQPLIGKYILPWFGGGPGVWTTCMLFFQVLLLGGYAYAHLLSQKFKPRTQAIVHLVLLAAAVALLPITPSDSWKPDGAGNPTLQILALLTVCLGLPYFVLSATGPLMQQWFSRTNPGVSPYRLYALSNVGSLLALLSYPFYFETHFTRIVQARMWAVGLVVFVFVCGWCALKLWKAAVEATPRRAGVAATPSSPPSVDESGSNSLKRDEGVASTFGDEASVLPAQALSESVWTKLLWLLLPACASILLLATTNKLCQDVAVIPFLWVLPLALYLLSFIICFDNPRWYVRGVFALALVAVLAGICGVMFQGVDASLRQQVVAYSAGLFVCCMVCHGELYRLRPDPRRLTGFYLMIAAGGALGGVFVAVIAPKIFTDYHELNWGLLLCAWLFVAVCALEKSSGSRQWPWLACALTLAVFFGLDWSFRWLNEHYPEYVGNRLIGFRIGVWALLGLLVLYWVVRKKFRTFQHWRLLSCVWLGLGACALGGVLKYQAAHDDDGVISRSRNFYGTLKVCEYYKDDPDSHYFLLQLGRITHGIQFTEPGMEMQPTSYYGGGSGVKLVVRALPEGPRRIGVVGLGTGSMAVFGRAGDDVRIYEINEEVRRLAASRFTYLSKSPAKVEVALGDARLSLEREASQNFDLLALDAFSSDAIPVHLLTKEAFALYDRHLKTNGVLAVHVSNRYLNLEPVVTNLAREFDYQLAVISYDEAPEDEFDEEAEWWIYSSTWILLTRSADILKAEAIARAMSPPKTNDITIPLWTDDFASVFQILN